MKRSVSKSWACLLLGSLLMISCQSDPDPRKLLTKAIEAHGGEKSIFKPRKGILRGASKNDDIEIRQEEMFDLPDRWKRVTVATIDGKTKTGINLMIRGKYWEWEEGGMARQTNNEAGTTSHLELLTTLSTFLKDPNVKLAPLPDTQVRGKGAAGLRAIWNGKTSDYYFDKATGLPVLSAFRWQREGKEYQTKCEFAEYKEVDGVRLPFRRTYYLKGGNYADYVMLTDFVVAEVKLLDSVPDETFAIPDNK